MNKNNIENVTQYFEPHVNDCFSNAMSSVMLHKNINPNIVFADYMSFMIDEEDSYVGVNYLIKPLVIEPKGEECSTSFEFINLPELSSLDDIENVDIKNDKINLLRLTTTDYDQAFQRVKDTIDGGTPCVLSVDLFYISYHKAYKKEHGIHNIVITGYDESEKYYELFDRYKYSGSNFEGKLSFDEIEEARTSDNPSGNVLSGDVKNRPINNLMVEMVIGEDFKITKEQVMRIINESCLRMKSEKKVLGYSCGYKAMDLFIDKLKKIKDAEDSPEKEYLVKVYYRDSLKQISRNRLRFKVFLNSVSELIGLDCVEELTENLDQSAKYWDISSSLLYKYSITKKPVIIDQVCDKICAIKDLEKKIVDKLSSL